MQKQDINVESEKKQKNNNKKVLIGIIAIIVILIGSVALTQYIKDKNDDTINYTYATIDNVGKNGKISGTKCDIKINEEDLDILTVDRLGNILNDRRKENPTLTVWFGNSGTGVVCAYLDSTALKGGAIIYGKLDNNGNIEGDPYGVAILNEDGTVYENKNKISDAMKVHLNNYLNN